MTWIHCNKCGNPIMHPHDPYIEDEEEREKYHNHKIMEEAKKEAICRDCCPKEGCEGKLRRKYHSNKCNYIWCNTCNYWKWEGK